MMCVFVAENLSAKETTSWRTFLSCLSMYTSCTMPTLSYIAALGVKSTDSFSTKVYKALHWNEPPHWLHLVYVCPYVCLLAGALLKPSLV